jgi:ATP-dependent metalloprotease
MCTDYLQVTQILQPVWTVLQPIRIQHSSILSFHNIEPVGSNLPRISQGLTFLQPIASRNYAAELFQGPVPSIRHSELIRRSFGPPPTAQSVLSTRSTRPSLYATTPSLLARRQIWTSAWKAVKRFTPDRITNPMVYSRIVALEAEANAFPHNVSKQVTLWRAILDMDTPTGYQRIINRWERLLEFVGRHAHSRSGYRLTIS